MNDKDKEAFEKWKLEYISTHTGYFKMIGTDDLAQVAWQAACEYKQNEIDNLSGQLKQRLEIAIEHLKFTTHAAEYLYKPDVKLHKTMTPTFYFTLTYEGDLELIERCKSAMEFLAKISAENAQ